MMQRFLCLVIALLIISTSTPTNASVIYSVSVEIEKLPELDGTSKFSMSFRFASSFDFSKRNPPPLEPIPEVSLHSGSGSLIADAISTSTHFAFFNIKNLSYSELTNHLTEGMIFQETHENSEVFQYRLDLPTISTDSFPESPVITSPAENQIVTSPFTVEWESLGGIVTSTKAKGRGVIPRPTSSTATSRTVQFQFLGDVSEGSITYRVGTDVDVNFDVLRLSNGATSRFGNGTFRGPSLRLQSFSLPRTFIATVPEPGALTLVSFALIIIQACPKRHYAT